MPVPIIPPRAALGRILDNEKACFDYLVSKGILSVTKICACGESLGYNETRKIFRCSSRKCRKSFSIFAGTFFHMAKLPLHQIIDLAYHWLSKASVSTTIAQTGRSSETVCAYFRYFRELVADSLDEANFCIGGPGIVVELDESKFGKRKYHRGHRVEGAWVLGGVERTPERRIFLSVVPDRSLQTLEDVISRHVYAGSIVHTDLWRGYSQLAKNFDYMHLTVNHSRHFVDPTTQVHTNTIEGTWAGIKLGIPRRNRTKDEIDEHLFEFIWRRTNELDLWSAFMCALKEVAYQ
jgi:hypothetical protein